MYRRPPNLFWLLLILTFVLGLAALVACDAPFTPAFTPTDRKSVV